MTAESLKKTPLHDLEKKAGAVFREYAGWLIPDHFGLPAEEERCARQAAGLIDVSCRAKIRVSGKDRASFLHGMVSNDVKKLKSGGGVYAAILDAQARMLADLHLFCFEDSLLMDATASLTQKIITTLDKYIIMEDVTLKNVTGDYAFLGIEGPTAPKLLNTLSEENLDTLTSYAHKKIKLGNFEPEIFKLSFTGSAGYYLLIEAGLASDLWGFLLKQGSTWGLKPIGAAALNTLRVEAGIPWYGLDMDEKNLLPETGLNHAISLDKGCYIGQEVVARLSSFAKVNKKLVGLEMDTDHAPKAGGEIFCDGKKIGYVTSSVFSSALNQWIGLGYAARDYAAPGTRVSVESGGQVQARVVSLPFVSCRKT